MAGRHFTNKVSCISILILFYQVTKTISTFAKVLTTGKIEARMAASLTFKIRKQLWKFRRCSTKSGNTPGTKEEKCALSSSGAFISLEEARVART